MPPVPPVRSDAVCTPNGAKLISRSEFERVVTNYEPLSYETYAADDPRFSFRIRDMHYVLKNHDRFWEAIKWSSAYFPAGPFTVLDLGTYPGSLLRLLHRLLPAGRCTLVGMGLRISDEFRQDMASDSGAEILTVNLDPRNEQLRDKGYTHAIPLEQGSVEFVYALEIVEHLISPTHLFSEAFRICKPGGHMVVATPNITRIGNVFKLLSGRSNYDRLVPPDYDHPEDEWRPHFCEYTLDEVCGYLGKAGFDIVDGHQIVAEDVRYNVRSVKQRLIDAAKRPFYLVPHLRDSLIAIGQKPVAR